MTMTNLDVQTKNKTAQWAQTGQNLPGLANVRHVQIMPQSQAIAATDLDAVTHVTNRCLVDLLGTTMQQVSPLARNGRIVLCEVVPMYALDPILPVPVVRMSGWRGWLHRRKYRQLMDYLIWYEERAASWNGDPAAFVKAVKPLVYRLPWLAAPYLRAGELAYYADQLVECMTNPQRHDMARLRRGRRRVSLGNGFSW
jgi:hypothetical protein